MYGYQGNDFVFGGATVLERARVVIPYNTDRRVRHVNNIIHSLNWNVYVRGSITTITA